MENYMEEKQEIKIDESSRYNLLEAARWGKFLAIVGLVCTVLIAVAGLFMGSFIATLSAAGSGTSPMPPFFFALLYFIMALIYIYPVYALYKFSVLTKRALIGNEQLMFNTATGFLKNMFKYLGILTIIIICLYGVGFLFVIVAGVASGFSN